jgi:hypothetical protein
MVSLSSPARSCFFYALQRDLSCARFFEVTVSHEDRTLPGCSQHFGRQHPSYRHQDNPPTEAHQGPPPPLGRVKKAYASIRETGSTDTKAVRKLRLNPAMYRPNHLLPADRMLDELADTRSRLAAIIAGWENSNMRSKLQKTVDNLATCQASHPKRFFQKAKPSAARASQQSLIGYNSLIA